MVLGLGGVGWFFTAPRVDAKSHSDNASGTYTVSAAPGLGYGYRWDLNNDGKWDSDDYGTKAEISLNLAVKENRTVRLEVKNAFGRTAVKSFSFTRPPPDLSGIAERDTPARAVHSPTGFIGHSLLGGAR
jgi:hypothetical protein